MATPAPTNIADWHALGLSRARDLGTAHEDNGHGLALALGASDFLYKELKRRPDWRDALLSTDLLTRTLGQEDYTTALTTALKDTESEEAFMRALRSFRRQHMARIAWRDIAQLADFETIAHETTLLADALIEVALDRAHREIEQRYGVARHTDGSAQQMVVFALGKLGAGELNFSSDIDLIFAFPEAGTTDGAREMDHEEFFPRVARRLMKFLGEVTGDGIVYRVDMRLRPFGTAGAMVLSFDAMEDYYQTHGRDWERYAWIRARVVAGDQAGGTQLLGILKPFIYRRYLDFGALESLREMKALINAEVQRGGLQNNVKVGPGGIREIEFIVQAFQLVRGGRMPELRGREAPKVLARLAAAELMPAFAADALADAYAFLRTLEHRLQQVDDQQLHVLPEAAPEQARIALAMQVDSWDALMRTLNHHRELVRTHFDQVFGYEEGESRAPISPLVPLIQASLSAEIGVALLEHNGFEDDPEQAFEVVRRLVNSLPVRSLGERGQQRFERLLPQLVEATAKTSAPTTTLVRLCELLQTIAPRSTYMALLVERPLALSQLVRLCAASPLIAHHIRRYPLVIDELLDPRSLYAPLRKAALHDELAARLAALEDGDLEQEMEMLRREKQTNLLRVAAADVAEALPLMVVSDHLTEIAEVCVEQALNMTWRDLKLKHGTPAYEMDDERHEAGVAIIGYGKLGGIELGYGSDLDVVYLHSSRGTRQQTDGPREVDNELFFARLAQRFGHVITTHTPAGVLYELDIRLRPNGSKGLPVIGLDGFRTYQLEEAWTWEHQALVRARFICGDQALGEEFARVRREILLLERDEASLKQDVRDMRERMRAHLDQEQADEFDLKQGLGGITDIEFIVQYLVLRSAAQLGEFLEFTDNIRLLDGIAAGGLLPEQDAAALADAFRAFRARGHTLALQELDACVPESEFVEERARVQHIWAAVMD